MSEATPCVRGKKYIYYPAYCPDHAFAEKMRVSFEPEIKCPKFAGGEVELVFTGSNWTSSSFAGFHFNLAIEDDPDFPVQWYAYGCVNYIQPVRCRDAKARIGYLGSPLTDCCDEPDDSVQSGWMNLFLQGCGHSCAGHS